MAGRRREGVFEEGGQGGGGGYSEIAPGNLRLKGLEKDVGVQAGVPNE